MTRDRARRGRESTLLKPADAARRARCRPRRAFPASSASNTSLTKPKPPESRPPAAPSRGQPGFEEDELVAEACVGRDQDPRSQRGGRKGRDARGVLAGVELVPRREPGWSENHRSPLGSRANALRRSKSPTGVPATRQRGAVARRRGERRSVRRGHARVDARQGAASGQRPTGPCPPATARKRSTQFPRLPRQGRAATSNSSPRRPWGRDVDDLCRLEELPPRPSAPRMRPACGWVGNGENRVSEERRARSATYRLASTSLIPRVICIRATVSSGSNPSHSRGDAVAHPWPGVAGAHLQAVKVQDVDARRARCASGIAGGATCIGTPPTPIPPFR